MVKTCHILKSYSMFYSVIDYSFIILKLIAVLHRRMCTTTEAATRYPRTIHL